MNTPSQVETCNIFLEDIFEINWASKTARVRTDSEILKLHFWLVPWVFLKELLLRFWMKTNFFGKEVSFLWKVRAGSEIMYLKEEDTISLQTMENRVVTSIDIGHFETTQETTTEKIDTILQEPNGLVLPHWKQFQLVTYSWFHSNKNTIEVGDSFSWYREIPIDYGSICPESIPDSLVEESCAQMIANAYSKRNPTYTLLYGWSASIRLANYWFQGWEKITISWYITSIQGNNLRAQYTCKNSKNLPIFKCEIIGSKFPMGKLVKK